MPEEISRIALRPSMPDMRSAVSVRASNRFASENAGIVQAMQRFLGFERSVVKSVRISGRMS